MPLRINNINSGIIDNPEISDADSEFFHMQHILSTYHIRYLCFQMNDLSEFIRRFFPGQSLSDYVYICAGIDDDCFILQKDWNWNTEVVNIYVIEGTTDFRINSTFYKISLTFVIHKYQPTDTAITNTAKEYGNNNQIRVKYDQCYVWELIQYMVKHRVAFVSFDNKNIPEYLHNVNGIKDGNYVHFSINFKHYNYLIGCLKPGYTQPFDITDEYATINILFNRGSNNVTYPAMILYHK